MGPCIRRTYPKGRIPEGVSRGVGPIARGNTMISVVEWFAPSRNAAWVAACFGSLGE
jgi:hypothetical protein